MSVRMRKRSLIMSSIVGLMFLSSCRRPATRPTDDLMPIPAAEFQLGRTPNSPGTTVTVAAFQLDRTEVTVGMYEKCVAAHACTPPHENWPACNWRQRGVRARHPINCVDWKQADAYCSWRNARLPSEAEWEYAARGSDGRLYPWGATEDKSRACIATGGTCEVGSYASGASPFGVLDLTGNLKEWTSTSAVLPGNGVSRVLRGSGWEADPLSSAVKLTVLERETMLPTQYAADIGFRCAAFSEQR